MLQWSGLWQYPVIGFNAAGHMYSNHPYSFSSNANDIACLSDNYTHIIFKISSEPSAVQLERQSCWSWYFEDIEFYGSVTEYFADAPPCPCTIFQADYDLQWEYYYSTSDTDCYINRFTTPFDVGQLCCYYFLRNGEAVLQGNDSGGFLLFYPHDYDTFITENGPKQICCRNGLCDTFQQRKPLQTCGNYEIPTPGELVHIPSCFNCYLLM